MEHGNKMNATTKVGISLSLDKTKLKVSIGDKGKGFDINKIRKPDIDNKIEGNERARGWGIFLIKSLMDDVKFELSKDGNNVTTLIIHLGRMINTDKQGKP